MIARKKFILAMTIITVPLLAHPQDIDYAKQFILNERYSSAEEVLEKKANTEATEPEVNYLLVKTYLEQDKINEAKTFVQNHLQPAVDKDKDPLNRITLARYLLSSGNKRAAGEIFASILNDNKNRKDASLLIAMAEVYIDEDEGDVRLAINWLDMAEKRNNHEPDIDILRGLAYRRLMDVNNAFSSFQNALKKDPQNVKAHYLIGKIFRAQKNPDVYMEHFLKAYQIDSTYAPVLEELYNHYYYRDIKQAKKYLEKYIANSDYTIKNDYYMTDILYLNGEFQSAIESAKRIIEKQSEKSQPRLYKLMAYSFAKSGDSVQALQSINDYFAKEDPVKIIAADFEFRAELTERVSGTAKETITYYSRASEMDTVSANKVKYATRIANLYQQSEDYHNQAAWLGKLYQWKDKPNNIDLFNWGLAHYSAKEYLPADSLFSIYTTRYPEDIYGYYWRAQVNAAIDTSMETGLAIPYYNKVVEIGERNKEKSTKMLLKAYGYLGGYEANIMKDYEKSLGWFEKYLEIDNENADINGYAEMLKKWIAQKK